MLAQVLVVAVCPVFILGIFFGGEAIPPPQNFQSPQTAAKLCALNLYFCSDSELQIYYGNFLLMDNKRRKLFVIKQSKWCRFMPKMHQNMFGGRGAYAVMRSLIAPSLSLRLWKWFHINILQKNMNFKIKIKHVFFLFEKSIKMFQQL